MGDGACGCVQVAGVGFNGPMFPQIDLGRIGGGKGEESRTGSNGLTYFLKGFYSSFCIYAG